ncbi:hypothetical protein M1N60_00250, partial [Thermodesulfovibrionales bacterium]|nr:hypothetical protein [Thermodesulfovibrionales bacterium]
FERIRFLSSVEMTKWLFYCHFEAWSAEKSSKVGVLQEPHDILVYIETFLQLCQKNPAPFHSKGAGFR